jgi:hypothetical protein
LVENPLSISAALNSIFPYIPAVPAHNIAYHYILEMILNNIVWKPALRTSDLLHTTGFLMRYKSLLHSISKRKIPHPAFEEKNQ